LLKDNFPIYNMLLFTRLLNVFFFCITIFLHYFAVLTVTTYLIKKKVLVTEIYYSIVLTLNS